MYTGGRIVCQRRPALRTGRRAGERRTLFYHKVFREEAVARRARREPLDARLQVTAPHEWMVVAGIGLSLLVFVVWAAFGSVERRLAVDAVLVRPGERHAVVSPVSGSVVETAAGVGDAVEAGQAIARVRPPEAEREARVARRIVGAVEAGMGRSEGAAAALREALLAAARRELGAVERREGESIAAPRAGELLALRLVPGQPVRVGETVAWIRDRSEESWQALAFAAPRDAARLAAGMDAEVLTAPPGRPGPGALAARVLEVSPRPAAAPPWLAGLGLAPPGPAHLVRLVVAAPPPPLADGAPVRARIALGRRSLAALLLAGGTP